jgi:hypothetical protein
MSEHTPGPWNIEYDDLTEQWLVSWEDGFAEVGGLYADDKASLIAAAPEMLDALQLIATYPEEVDPVAVAEKAIAKARGEADGE